MAIEINVYANGNDPYTFTFFDLTFHFYTGAPPPPPGIEPTQVVPPISPIAAPIKLSAYPRMTDIRPPMELAIAEGEDEIKEWLNQVKLESKDQPVRFRLDTVSDPSRKEIQTLLEGVRGFRDSGAKVDIVGVARIGGI